MQRTLRVFFKLVGQSKVATLASGAITEARHGSAKATIPKLSPSKLLNVADKRNKCKYLIDTGAAVSVLPKSCANRTSDAACLPLVAASNSTINTYGTSRRTKDIHDCHLSLISTWSGMKAQTWRSSSLSKYLLTQPSW